VGPVVCGPTMARSARTILGVCDVQARGGLPGGGGLGGALLGLAEFGDRGSQGGEVGDHCDGDQCGIAGGLAGHRQ
jgi:hypothetical protein